MKQDSAEVIFIDDATCILDFENLFKQLNN